MTGSISGLHDSNILNTTTDFADGVANLTALGIRYIGNPNAGNFTAASSSGTTGTSNTVTTPQQSSQPQGGSNGS